MTRRPGLTMTEVLVAIFIVAIGLVGVMSMFPFGAKQMSDALVSDRATTHATATDGLVRGYWKEKIVEFSGNNEPFWNALDNPGTTPSGTALPQIPPTSSAPSYPVFLDPMGVVGRGGSNANWVGDATGAAAGPTAVPRRNMNLILFNPSPQSLALRLWSQPDGFSWDEDSKPLVNTPGDPITRELRYNSLAVIQRPVNRDRSGATLKVVVFINRRHLFYPDGSEPVFPNAASPAPVTFTPGSTQLQLSTNADIRKGSWIMDATIDSSQGIRHANFYRVVSATDNGSTIAVGATQFPVYDVELSTPIKRVDGGTGAYNGVVVVMAGAAEVFERPVLTGSINPP